jgi:hypothetical protein
MRRVYVTVAQIQYKENDEPDIFRHLDTGYPITT